MIISVYKNNNKIRILVYTKFLKIRFNYRLKMESNGNSNTQHKQTYKINKRILTYEFIALNVLVSLKKVVCLILHHKYTV